MLQFRARICSSLTILMQGIPANNRRPWRVNGRVKNRVSKFDINWPNQQLINMKKHFFRLWKAARAVRGKSENYLSKLRVYMIN